VVARRLLVIGSNKGGMDDGIHIAHGGFQRGGLRGITLHEFDRTGRQYGCSAPGVTYQAARSLALLDKARYEMSSNIASWASNEYHMFLH